MKEKKERAYCSRKEAADRIGCSEQTVSNYLERGLLEGIRGRSLRVSVSSLDEFMGRGLITRHKTLEQKARELDDEISVAEGMIAEVRGFHDTYRRIDPLRAARMALRKLVDGSEGVGERDRDILLGYLDNESIDSLSAEHGLTAATVCGILARTMNIVLSRMRDYESVKARNVALEEENRRLQAELSYYKGLAGGKTALPLHGAPLLMSRLDEHEFSVRAMTCFRLAGVEYVYQLVQMGRDGVSSMRHCGRRTVEEIESFIDDRGLRYLYGG